MEKIKSTTVLAVLQRVLYLAVTVAVGWAVYFFLLSRLSRGPEQAWVFLPVWLILAYALLPRVHKILSSLYIPDYFIGRARTGDGVLGDARGLRGFLLRETGLQDAALDVDTAGHEAAAAECAAFDVDRACVRAGD